MQIRKAGHFILWVVTALLCLTSCNQQDSNEEIKQQLKQLQEQLNSLSKNVEDIHVIAMRAQRPKSKELKNIVDFQRGGSAPFIGSKEAEIAIIEFSDFQCPYCKRFIDATFPEIKKNYIDTGRIAYYVRDFPLSFHPKAKSAAVVAYCANKQRKYWPTRDLLFNNMKDLGDELYSTIATKIDLNETEFKSCLKNTSEDFINNDVALGRSLGVAGTPSFIIGQIQGDTLINPKMISGAQPYAKFTLFVSEYINKLDTKQIAPTSTQ